MIVDAAIIGSLIVVAQLLRARATVLRRALVPTSMIAGFLGLACGPYGMNVLPFSRVDQSPDASLAISRVPAVLIVVVFATLLMGHRANPERLVTRLVRVRSTILYNFACELGQFGLAMALGVGAMALLGGPSQFAVMLPAGFAGGAGTSTVFAAGFAQQGWPEALSVGFAFAAIGQLAAIVGGMMLVNLAARRRWIGGDNQTVDCSGQLTATFCEGDAPQPIGYVTSNPGVLDPLAWHLALIGAVYGIALGIDAMVHKAAPGAYVLPTFAIAMLVGAAMQGLLNAARVGVFVDALTMQRIGAASADLLIVCSIASIKLSVLRGYALPIALFAVFGVLYSLAAFAAGKWVFREHWLERSLFTYGWMTGVVGASVALVRVVDPRQKSNAIEDYGSAYLALGPLEMLLYPTVIWACAAHRMGSLGVVLTVLAFALLLAARCTAAVPRLGPLRALPSDNALDSSLVS